MIIYLFDLRIYHKAHTSRPELLQTFGILHQYRLQLQSARRLLRLRDWRSPSCDSCGNTRPSVHAMADAIYETEMFGIETPSANTLASTTANTHTTSTAPYSSEGPTLPILGGAGEHGVHIAVSAPAAGKRLQAEVEAGHTGQQTQTRRSKQLKTSEVAATQQSRQKPVPAPQTANPELEPLKRPWMLLPPDLLAAVYKRLGKSFWEENCVPVVMTRNQNIRSGVNKLKSYLGATTPNASVKNAKEVVEVLRSECLVIAVSAMGAATTKLVGVLEVLRRVVGGADGEVEAGGEGEGVRQREEWYMYTNLGSILVEKKARIGNKQKRDGMELVDEVPSAKGPGVETGRDGEESASFEPTAADEQTTETGEKTPKVKSVPILTVWLSRTSIPEFEKELGEEKFIVVKA
jgi:hypothetical protein